MKVKEIFYSIQGEGGRQGEASIFIRLAGCNLNCDFCDTDWKDGKFMTIQEIKKEISQYPSDWIVWTGGEPTLQLTDLILAQFSNYKHAIETNGTRPVPHRINYVACSPKEGVSPDQLKELFPFGLSEFRYLIQEGDSLPKISDLPYAYHYYVSPAFTGDPNEKMELSKGNVKAAVDWVLENPEWKLSLQIHKMIKIK